MLSYRHSYHAGNFADVLKHIVVTDILQSLTKKDKPFDYIDTHAGAGMYKLDSGHASKLAEYKQGVAKINPEVWPEISRYIESVAAVNGGTFTQETFASGAAVSGKSLHYPGSPMLAADFLRPKDGAWLYELHPKDSELLRKQMGKQRNVRVFQEDGLRGMLSLLPPASRRALVLVDPSYEVKAEYEHVFTAISSAHKKFATGIYALWYPVVDRTKINTLEKRFVRSGIRDIQRFEFGLSADSRERGMTASGMIVVNPPWGLRDRMLHILPKLVSSLGEPNSAHYRCDILVDE